MVLKAIETRYKNYRFRSRLEARWACFLDALEMPWQYEPEGFDLGGMAYLPDFHTEIGWLEIKGQEPTLAENEMARRLAQASGEYVFLFVGLPTPFNERAGDGGYLWRRHSGDWDNLQAWCGCLQCDAYSIRYEGDVRRLRCGCPHKGRVREHPSLTRAYAAARSARFEHGERGR